MKISKVPGDFFFPALFKEAPGFPWQVSGRYLFRNRADVEEWMRRINAAHWLWPIEICEDGSIYLPSKEELNEEESNTKTS